MHSQYIFKAISRIFSWSIVKYFEPRNCFWDSVGRGSARQIRKWKAGRKGKTFKKRKTGNWKP